MSAPRIPRRSLLIAAGVSGLSGVACSSRSEGGRAPAGSGPSIIGATDPAVAKAEAARASTGTVVRKTMRAGAFEVELGGRTIETWGYDGAIHSPGLRAKVGDTLEVVLNNDLPEATTIHWHGLALRNDMDGVHDLTQGPVDSGDSFVYRFTVPHAGTYWFHPHMGLQLDRALYAPLVVDEPDEVGAYDVDEVVVLDDWLDGFDTTPEEAFNALTEMDMDMEGMDHGSMEGMDHGSMGGMAMFQSKLLGGDAGDVAYPLHLINGRSSADRPSIAVPEGGRARLRFINAGSDTAYRVCLGGHRMTITHADGYPVEPIETEALLIGMGERYDVLVAPSSGAWPLVALAEGKDQIAAAVVRTAGSNGAAPPPDVRPAELEGTLVGYDDLRAAEHVQLKERPADVSQTIELTGSMMPYSWTFDGAAFPDRPPVEVRQGQRVRLTFDNTSAMWHPIHLHGHTFRVGEDAVGVRKDTVNVLPGERVVVEFDADNPGQWMAHCHNTYHLERGMAMLISYVK
jgi:FtsP/CotA-like multicopper oxidase with cupredoxin domain